MKLNGSEVEFGRFPNMELNLPTEGLGIRQENTVRWRFSSNEDIVKLAMLDSHMADMNAKRELYVEYLPYSRMDRPNGHYAVSLKFIAYLINNMGFVSIKIREPHSDASLQMINNSSPEWWCSERIGLVLNMCGAESVFYPDDGAKNRYLGSNKHEYAVGKKKRSFSSGKITGMKISGTVKPRVLIVDDLCSRGGTFVSAAKLLREEGAKNIFLLVAHCENTIFTGEIFDHIDTVFTSREMLDKDHPRITKIK